jgi:spore coat polysaccharide biosynthesis protein SpsF
LLDGEVIDLVVSKFHGGGEGGYDYVSNVDPATFPDGLDTEVFSFTALARAWRDARLPSEREHVTPYIRNRRDLFRAACVRNDVDLSHYRWTVDEAEDLELVRTIYSLLPNLKFSYRDVLNLIVREPRLGRMNAHLARNEGYLKSLQMDQKQSRGEKG